MSNYTVIHSTDPWLLARLSTDLMMEGVKDDREWAEGFKTDEDLPYLVLDECDPNYIGFSFYSIYNPMVQGVEALCIEITESNYTQVLTTIIERHGK